MDVPTDMNADGSSQKRKLKSEEYTLNKKKPNALLSLPSPQHQEDRQQKNEQAEMHLDLGKKKTCKTPYYYTFVMEGKPTLPTPNISFNVPVFIVIDHTDHTHIAFNSLTNNAAARGNRVWNFIKKVDEEQEISRTPTLRIRHVEFKGWISALVKYGIEKISYFGKEDATFKHIANTLYSSTDGPSEISPCSYRKGRPEEMIIIEKSKNEIDYDYIWDIAEEKNVRTPHELFRAMNKWELKEYFGHFGTSQNRKTKIVMRNLNLIRNKEELDESIVERFIRTEPKGIVHADLEKWLETFFSLNKLNMINFLAWFIIIADRKFPKINTFLIRGPTNTGKSVVINTLLKGENFAKIMRDGKGLILENLLDRNYVLYEEPDVTSKLSNYFKLLFEGTPIEINAKHDSSITLKRTPMFVTSNHPLDASVCQVDKIAFQTRIKEFVFEIPIDHPTYKFENPMEAAPQKITHNLWVHIFKKNRTQIEEEVEKIMKRK